MKTRTIRITENDEKKLRVEKILYQPEAGGVFDSISNFPSRKCKGLFFISQDKIEVYNYVSGWS